MAMFHLCSPREVVFVRVDSFHLFSFQIVNEVIMKISLPSCENSGTDIFLRQEPV